MPWGWPDHEPALSLKDASTVSSFMRDSFGSARIFSEKSEAFISFAAQDEVLIIDAAISNEGTSNSARVIFEG